MAMECILGAVCKCSFGLAPSTLVTIPKGPPVTTQSVPDGTIMDHIPMANIMPFGMCTTPSNPAVAAATTAAAGVLTPMPCVPVTPAPWVPGSPTVLINNMPALNNTSTLMCTWGGVITITYPGQTTVMVP